MRKHERADYDFVVVGGGFTGLCAALAAARRGVRCALIHDRPVLGGNGSSEIRMHICGANANMKKPELTEGGIIHELMLDNKRVNDNFSFSTWDAVLFEAVRKEKNLTLYLNTAMHDAKAADGCVTEIYCYQMTTEKHLTIAGKIFADCTGNGTLCAFVDAPFKTGSEAKDEYGEPHAPEKANNKRMGNTLLFKAADRGHPVKFTPPTEIMHFTEEELKYRKHAPTLSPDVLKDVTPDEFRTMFSGYAPDYGYWWIEIPGNEEDIIGEYESIRDQLVAAIYGVWDHIKNGGEHGADNYELIWVGMLPGVRESRRVLCDYMLTENDILENRRFADTVAYGGWDIDSHNSLFDFAKKPSFVFPFEGSYDIPYRSYLVKGFQNLFVGGRCMGTSKLAMASTRVMGTCAIGGQAIGTAASLAIADRVTIREVAVNKLQQALLRDDCYLPEITGADENDLAHRAAISVSSFTDGNGADNLTNGVTRALRGKSNAWISEAIRENEPETITLTFKEAVSVDQIQLVFDSNFLIEKKITLSSTRQKQQELGVPHELVKDFTVELLQNGKVIEQKEVCDNHKRLLRLSVHADKCDGIKVKIQKTWGTPSARVFEIRVYRKEEA